MKMQAKNARDGAQLISFQGDLDFHCASELRSELMKLAERQASKVAVDFKKVNYIDSSGLAAFVELFQSMKRYGGKLVLYHLTDGVRSVFEVAKLDSIFRLARSEEEALSLVSTS